MKNNTFAVGLLIALAVGLLIGYAFWGGNQMGRVRTSMSGGHMMPDGSMMGGNSMQNMMDGMMMNLEGKTGDAFDKAFLSEMIMHHEGAVVMAEAVLASSKRPELIQLANEIIAAQTKEINMMKSWQKSWFNQ